MPLYQRFWDTQFHILQLRMVTAITCFPKNVCIALTYYFHNIHVIPHVFLCILVVVNLPQLQQRCSAFFGVSSGTEHSSTYQGEISTDGPSYWWSISTVFFPVSHGSNMKQWSKMDIYCATSRKKNAIPVPCLPLISTLDRQTKFQATLGGRPNKKLLKINLWRCRCAQSLSSSTLWLYGPPWAITWL